MNSFLLGAWLTLCADDAILSHTALRLGAEERFLTQNSTVNTAIISAQAVGWTVVSRRLAKSHPRWARGLTVALVAIRGWAVVNNVQVIHELRVR